MKKRLISMLLTVVMLVGLIPCFITNAYAAEDWRAWMQSDSRWGSNKLGASSATMSGEGCLVTSVAKIMVQSGFKDAASFNPGTLIKWLNENHSSADKSFTSSGGLYYAKPTKMTSGLKLVSHEYGSKNGITGSSSNCESKLLKLVKDNYHVFWK